MQVILLERVEKLGAIGDVVAVKPGFARNFLLPQNKALRATKDNIAYFETQKKHLEAENEKRRTEAEKLAKKVDGADVTLIRQASESGQLYGSVNARDIAGIVNAKLGDNTVNKKQVIIDQNYKTLGLFPIRIMLHPEVSVTVTVNIARSEEEAKMQEERGEALVTANEEPEPIIQAVQAAEALEEAEAESEAEESDAAETEDAKDEDSEKATA
ncbi:MAG: 50S ribosomal protein L9 [Pseudomonadota bacterium]